MSAESISQKYCPTCGSKISESATRCSVCGRYLTPSAKPETQKTVKSPKLPMLTLNLPVAIGFFVILVAIGAAVTFLLLRSTGNVVLPTPTVTATVTSTITPTPTETPTETPAPTATPLPPVTVTVGLGQTCSYFAVVYNVTVPSIIDLNKLDPNCTVYQGKTILIPQPTYTPTPEATKTLSADQATQSACEKITYKVQSGDTIAGIAANYAISEDGLRAWNGITSNNLYSGTTIIIPLCERLPTSGPTPTPTTPPPYPAVNLLLPVDGAPYSGANDAVTLQWASVGTLRQNEFYKVTVEDVTAGGGRKIEAFVTDTSYIITVNFRPLETIPHVMRWYVEPVRQTGSDPQGNPVYTSAGAVSQPRIFTWSGVGAVTPTP
jgi:LysM repeat protein